VQPPSGWTLQFNFLTMSFWAQFVLSLQGGKLLYGVDAMPAAPLYYAGGRGPFYVMQPTADSVTVFDDTGVDPAKLASGEALVVLTLRGDNSVNMSLFNADDGSTLWATGTPEFPDFQFGKTPPYLGMIEAVGSPGGHSVTFTQFNAQAIVMQALQPLQSVLTQGIVLWGTYDDGVHGEGPLYWDDETGETSNLKTVISPLSFPQAITLSLTV
jgi:hypothetical protein